MKKYILVPNLSGHYTFGSFTCGGNGARLMLEGPYGAKILYAFKFSFKASNNEVKYEALIAGLKLEKDMGGKQLRALSNSMLVVQQVKGKYKTKGNNMVKYL